MSTSGSAPSKNPAKDMDGATKSANSLEERGAGKNKRKLTDKEDEKLVEGLMELVNTGKFKVDNGFKTGYLTFLEDSLHTKLPQAGIKGMPHIESQIKTLKKDFTAVYDIRYGTNSSRFGWNSEEQVHPRAAKWKTTQFSFFKELSIIFGKDRATKNLAENLEDVVEELNMEVADESEAVDDVQPSTHSEEATNKKKKEMWIHYVYAASERIANQFEASTKLLIAAEEDMMLKKKHLNEELSKIPKLDVLQKLQVAKKNQR